MNCWKNLSPVKNNLAKRDAFDAKYQGIFKGIKGRVRQKEYLKDYTTFKIGGPAKFLIEPKDTHGLKRALNLLKRYKTPIFVLGAGSNILVSDKGVNAAVIRLVSAYFKKVRFRGNFCEAGSGAMLKQVISSATRRTLSGMEFLAGIPATLGGALVMNAGVAEKNIGDLVKTVTVMDYDGKIKNLNKKDIKFGYRTSNFSKYIILGACIKLTKSNKQEIKDKIKRYLSYRQATQDLSFANAGCVFKNPKRYSAGKLIDLCGLKGKRIGDACISNKHANFILNLNKAKSRDVLKLMGLIKARVKKKFNINLESEIRIWQ